MTWSAGRSIGFGSGNDDDRCCGLGRVLAWDRRVCRRLLGFPFGDQY